MTQQPQIGQSARDHRRARWHSFWLGLSETRGLATGGLIFGLVFGAAAVARGFPEVQVIIMSAAVFAGAAQFAALELWADPLPLLALAITTALVCSRNILMGLTLPRLLGQPKNRPPLASLFLMTDVTWLLMRSRPTIIPQLPYFLGSGVAMYVTWVTGTAIGVLLPGTLGPETLEGLNAGGLLFIGILLTMLGRQDQGASILPWIVAAAGSIGASFVFDPSVAVLIGVAVGGLVTLCRELYRDA